MNSMASTVRVATGIPLGKINPETVVDRLRPEDGRVAVAGFNASI